MRNHQKSGRAPKGLSLIVRAAAISWRARLLPTTYQALHTLANILNELDEYSSAYSLMDGIMPRVLECEDAWLNAQCLSVMADSQVGMAGEREGVKRQECLNRALEFVDKASAGMLLLDIPFTLFTL